MGLTVLGRSDSVLLCKGAGKIGQIMEAGICCNINDPAAALFQPESRLLQAVILPVLGEALTGQLFEQLHKMAFGKAAHFGCLIYCEGRSIILLDVEQQFF